MKDETKRWLKKAREDMGTAEYNFKGNKLGAAAFYSQQTTEKALKALQIERLGKFDKIHDLLTLSKSVGAPEDVIESCAVLNPYYTITRYPDSEERIDEKEAKLLVEKARKVIGWAGQNLKQ